MASSTATASVATIVTLVTQGHKRGFTIRNSDANALYVLIGPGTVSASLHTVAIAQDGYYESPAFYNGEAVTGIWAADGSGSAFVTVL
jgi:hypothetical protein